MKAVIVIISIATLCFLGGYKYALSKPLPPSSLTLYQETDHLSAIETRTALTAHDNDQYHQCRDSFEENTARIKSTSKQNMPNEPTIEDIETILSHLENIDGQSNKGNIIATQYDLLKQMLINNPQNIDDTVAQLDTFSIEDPRFQLLLSALQSTPGQAADDALVSLAKHYSLLSDHQSQQKFVTLLTSTSSPIESEEVLQGLVDLTVMGQADINTKLEALSLLKPFQIRATEKDLIVEEITHLIYNDNGSDAEMLLPQLMRFSNHEQRAEMVTTMLSNHSENSLRVAVLDNINAGSIPLSEQIKTSLLSMANNEHDSLHIEAKNTLVNSAELSYQEYSQLTAMH